MTKKILIVPATWKKEAAAYARYTTKQPNFQDSSDSKKPTIRFKELVVIKADIGKS